MIVGTLLKNIPYIDMPYHLIGWLGWFGLAVCLFFGLRNKFQFISSKKFWTLFALLAVFAILTTLFIGLQLPWKSTLPLPNITRESSSPTIMLFAAIPLIMAAGTLGYWPAAAIGLISGLVAAFWNTHNLFTPLETAGLALLIAYAIRQNYRSKLFRWLRKPIGAAIAVAFIAIPIFLVTTFFSTNGALAERLDYALTQSWISMVVNAAQIMIAGFILDLALVTKIKYWIQFKSYIPSPYETGLQDKVFYIALPIVFVLLVTLAVADWVVAGKAAQRLMESRLRSAAEIASENMPSIIDTGQGILIDMVGDNFLIDNSPTTQEILQSKMRMIPFFTEFYLFDLTGAPVTGYPDGSLASYLPSPEEQAAVNFALNGVSIQNYVISPVPGETTAQIAFIAAIPDEYGMPRGVIAARTDLGVNLLTQPVIAAMQDIQKSGGEGVILDEDNRILYHNNPDLILNTYQGKVPEYSDYFEEANGTGTRRMVYASISEEKNWKVILSLPASYAQELALQIAIPLMIISLLISFGAYFLLRFMMGSLSRSLEKLANQADDISKGSLDKDIEVRGVDEVGRLGSAFEQMRASLKSRLEELDVLLQVSKGIASNFEINKAAAHLLKACLFYGADSARLILQNGLQFGFDEDTISFCDGRQGEEYAELDKVFLDQIGSEKMLVVPSKSRIKRVGGIKSTLLPSAVVAISLADDTHHYGMMWIAYTEPHRFYDEEIHFLDTIAGQAVLAISNSSLFMNAEVGKKRIESVLASTPEPVLVVGESGRLLMSNAAAENVAGLIDQFGSEEEGVREIGSPEFLEFLRLNRNKGKRTGEIAILGKTYEVSMSPVMVDEIMVGTVCVIRDITEYRELEKMKSDFVATVSHDLRAPMGIVRGYATMMQMVGEMNDQQKEYAAKIINDLDFIDQMVEKLLDLGRIESGSILQVEKASPVGLINEVVKILTPLATQRKVKIIDELNNSQNIEMEADKTLVKQALYNLIENAIKFSHLGGQVELRLQSTEESVTFEIQDHGPGIAPLDVDRIFDKFSRNGMKEGSVLRGAGLGLSIVKSIAEKHRGKVWVKSTLGKGSIFYFQIPISQVLSNRYK